MKRGILMMALAVTAVLTLSAQKKKETLAQVNVNYCLPKVTYNVVVTLEHTRYVPGPFRNYAAKELGINVSETKSGENWKIEKVKVNPVYLPDDKAVYSVSASGDYRPVYLALSAEGFLSGISAGNEAVIINNQGNVFVNTPELPEQSVDIRKFPHYNQMKEVLDSNYTMQEVDGVMKKIWDPIIHYAPKTEQDQVKEAVSEIMRIRSERIKLLAADNAVPDGKSLEIILKEFDRMEKNYLSLFTGVEKKERMVRTFECTPVKNTDNLVVFRFSEKEGISNSKNVAAQPYILRFNDVVVPASNPVSAPKDGAVIYYRVPATAEVQLLKGKEELMSFRSIIPQMGEIKPFSVEVISAENLRLEFYPQYGSLKSVKKNN